MRSVLYNPFEDWKKWSWINWEYKNEKKQQPEIPALGGRCEAILSPTPGVKEETYDSSGFYAERIIISPYAISHCREKLAKKKKKSWKCSRVQLVICLEVLFEVLLRVITASSLQIREFHRYIKRLEEKKRKKKRHHLCFHDNSISVIGFMLPPPREGSSFGPTFLSLLTRLIAVILGLKCLTLIFTTAQIYSGWIFSLQASRELSSFLCVCASWIKAANRFRSS